VLSLLFLVATAVLWLRGYLVIQTVTWVHVSGREFEVRDRVLIGKGTIVFTRDKFRWWGVHAAATRPVEEGRGVQKGLAVWSLPTAMWAGDRFIVIY
jgi:hypothetical protein